MPDCHAGSPVAHQEGIGMDVMELRRPVPQPEQVRPGLWSIGVPIPDNPLGYTLVYVIESDRGPVLVDAGWDDDESWRALEAGFRSIGSDIAECHGVLVTHFHPDHHGLSSRVREASGAWVAMHERDAAMARHLSSAWDRQRGDRGATSSDYNDEIISVLLAAGASEDELAAAPVPATRRTQRRFPQLAEPDRLVEDGERVDVPGWTIDAVWTPGHTPGHLCFHLPEQRMLLSGDHVLPSITPHIGISRADRGDPLADFLDSLQKIAGLDADDVLPAHRHRFQGLAERVDEITRHHLDHLASIEAVLAAGPQSLWQVAAQLTWNRPWDEYPLPLRRSAVNETAAHLRYLSRRGRAVRLKGVSPITFALGSAPG
jgi:glyoxylase-like metal-dependent hydrolase (beta-lactamase superfamily II)